MTDTDNFETAHNRHDEPLKNAIELNKTAVFDALATANIDSVVVDFDGEGDEGQLDNVAAYRNGEPLPLPAISLTLRRTNGMGSGELMPVETPLCEAIETLCYDYLSQEHDGWQNSNGAYGDFTFDVSARRIELQFHARFMDPTDYAYTF